MDKKKSLIVFVFCFFLLMGMSFALPDDIFNRMDFSNPFLAFIPTGFSEKETEPATEFFAETTANLENEIEEVIPKETETFEDMTGVGGPENPQEILDDIAEKFDIIKQKALVLIEEYNLKNNLEKEKEDDKLKLEVEEPEQEEEEKIEEEEKEDDFEIQKPPLKVKTPRVPSGGGNSAHIIYPKILISEVKISPVGERFVELFNPNNEAINLTNWYLQRKTESIAPEIAWNSFVSSTKFEGKIIPAGEYFLISREIAGSDILFDITLSDNNSLALKNPNGDISDKLGFGSSLNFETSPAQNPDNSQSLGRVFDEASQTYLDTDNNLVDFILDTPTPKAKNSVYVVSPPPPPPPLPPPPVEKDSTAPEVTFNLGTLQTSLTFPINFEITDILGTVTPSGISSYIFQWQEEGGVWQEDSEVSPSDSPIIIIGTREFTGEDEKTYYFQIKAKDTAGNESVWLPEIPISTKISIPKKVLINEIQISPVGERFVGLYNPSIVDINLAGWYLQRKMGDDLPEDTWGSFVSATNFENKIILAGGYFLISREIENSDILLDITLSDNNSLALKNLKREIVDKVGWGQTLDFEGSPAINPLESQSITRTGGIDTDDNSQDFTISDAPTPQGS